MPRVRRGDDDVNRHQDKGPQGMCAMIEPWGALAR
jgi:hypothetical protein